MRMLVSKFFSIFKLFLKLFHFLGQISHLAGIPTSYFLGLLSGIKVLSRFALLPTFLIELATPDGVMRGKGPTISLSSFVILGSSDPFLGGWSLRTASIVMLPRHTYQFWGLCQFLFVFLNKDLFNVL